MIEALEAQTTPEQNRHLIRITVVEICLDGSVAFEGYRQLHQAYPNREFYYVHTSREQMDIREIHWLGIRSTYAAGIER